MGRYFLLLFLNLSFPFVLYFLRLYLLRFLAERHKKKEGPPIIDVTPEPEKPTPTLRLLLMGFILAALTIAYLKLSQDTVDIPWDTGNQSLSREY